MENTMMPTTIPETDVIDTIVTALGNDVMNVETLTDVLNASVTDTDAHLSVEDVMWEIKRGAERFDTFDDGRLVGVRLREGFMRLSPFADAAEIPSEGPLVVAWPMPVELVVPLGYEGWCVAASEFFGMCTLMSNFDPNSTWHELTVDWVPGNRAGQMTEIILDGDRRIPTIVFRERHRRRTITIPDDMLTTIEPDPRKDIA